MSRAIYVNQKTIPANTVELALPGCWCCPLEGEAAIGRFGGEQ